MGVKSFHASGDGNALRLVAATQPRSGQSRSDDGKLASYEVAGYVA
jgi:hypothetical protein